MEAWRADVLCSLQENLADEDDELVLDQSIALSHYLLTRPIHGGSRPGRKANIERDRDLAHQRVWKDYFCENPVHGERMFRLRYRMSRRLFNRIMARVCEHDNYFIQKRDATGLLGLSSIQKCTAAIRMLAHGVGAHATDEYCKLGESTATESMKRFIRAVRELFERQYLRQPGRAADILTQLQINEQRGFPGMLASLDCMQYKWENCPLGWARQFQDTDSSKCITLEAVAGHDLRFWHAFFGLPGGNNDINIFKRFPLVANLLQSEAKDTQFMVNGTVHHRYYLLANEIYPKWSIFVQTIHQPEEEKSKHFAAVQKGVHEDVERAFGVLQSRFAIVQNPSWKWSRDLVQDVLMACVVLHNMIIQDERDNQLEPLFDGMPTVPLRRGLTFENYLQGTEKIEDQAAHYRLHNDLLEHLWALRT